MYTVPIEVARMVTIKKFHPVEAWRIYFGLSRKELAARIVGWSETNILEIESSNQHLKPKNSEKLAAVFGIYQDALNVRYFNS